MTTVRHGDATELDVVRAALREEYDVLEEIGRGGMAIVFRARERALDRDVAIKVLPFAMAFDADLVERFQREAKTAGQLEHPHIVPIYRVGRTEQVSYFVMQLVRGRSLSSVLREQGALPAAEVRRILIETAGALGYAARRGVVHRDIKPDNILLDADGRCLVTDFGIAKTGADQRLTATGMSLGTPRYMSPEQARAKPVDGRSDIYSLGVVGYECLVGAPPFDGEDGFAILLDHINAPLPRPPLPSDDDRSLFAIIERMLAKQPDDRFQSADELIAALGGQASPTGRGIAFAPVAAPVTAPSRTLTPTRPSVGAATEDRYPVASPPRASEAVDQALRTGLRFLHAQQPRMRRLLVAATGALRSGLSLAGRAAAGGARPAMSRARTLASAHRGRLATAAGVVMLLAGGWYALHFATAHRSRCPAPGAASQPQTAATAAGTSSARPFSLLVDAIAEQRAGSTLDVYYDVCGLEPGTAYRAQLALKRNESGLRRLLGALAAPVTIGFDERASSPATRRHRTMRLEGLEPGPYALTVTVSDAQGRRRETVVDFRVVER